MKIYQGESLAFVLKPKEDGDTLSDCTIDVAMISEQAIDCCNKNSHQIIPQVAIYWSNITINNNSAEFTLTEEQSRELRPGRYFLEIAIYDSTTVKNQTSYIIEILPSYTK